VNKGITRSLFTKGSVNGKPKLLDQFLNDGIFRGKPNRFPATKKLDE
jgi:hypothetical protein